MNSMMSVDSFVELRYNIGNSDEHSIWGFKKILLSDLRKGDIFRYETTEQREMIIDTFGYELFTCKSDAKYDDLRKWSVEIE